MAEIVLFGASGGIGQYLVKSLEAQQHQVFGTYCQSSSRELVPGASYHRVDVTDSSSVSEFVEGIAARLAKPVLIYAPGISPNATTHKYTDADWERTIATNLTGALRASRALLPIMRDRLWGRVIFLSSVLTRHGVPGTVAYSASKAALCAMARVIAVENATKGITANALALGYHSVGIIQTVPDQFLKEQVLPRIPQGKLGDPANISAAIRFLIDADYITGATIDINGGMFAP